MSYFLFGFIMGCIFGYFATKKLIGIGLKSLANKGEIKLTSYPKDYETIPGTIKLRYKKRG